MSFKDVTQQSKLSQFSKAILIFSTECCTCCWSSKSHKKQLIFAIVSNDFRNPAISCKQAVSQ